jgi:hypothetical protein
MPHAPGDFDMVTRSPSKRKSAIHPKFCLTKPPQAVTSAYRRKEFPPGKGKQGNASSISIPNFCSTFSTDWLNRFGDCGTTRRYPCRLSLTDRRVLPIALAVSDYLAKGSPDAQFLLDV